MDILYHYSTNDTFLAILTNKNLRLSSLTLSNDSMEGKVISSTVARLAENDKLSADVISHIQSTMARIGELSDGLGFCLSANGDLLSQWRGYALDGQGVSIGFSKKYLEWLSKEYTKVDDNGANSLRLDKVKYNKSEHEDEVRQTYEKIKNHINDGALEVVRQGLLVTKTPAEIEAQQKLVDEKYQKLIMSYLDFIPKLYALKTSAFKEEEEWRLVSFFVKGSGQQCLFRAVNNRLIPYRDFSLMPNDEHQPIKKIILGPKNTTPVSVVKEMLTLNGFKEVDVEQSTATYR